MNTTATLEQLKELKLQGMSRSYEAVLQLPVNQHPEAHHLIAQLSEAERQSRVQYKTQLYLKLSKLRYAGSLEEISYSASRNLAKEQILQLADCSYIDRSENILISGATGAGKSFLACALGHQACAMGYKTLYLNLNRFTEKIMVAKLDGSFVKLLNQLDKVSLLILDDFGLAPMDQNTRLALLQILEDRYNKKSVVIASQLPINKWHEYIAEPTLADAIMDRLMANAHRFELKGESLRKKSIKNTPEKR
ncbi:IS21-like element helper ATPase IstB [Pseudochryseolinea flava]|uniref:ATP-binding protein n=1 Tax=Pseudochryseolinea flava TaxID=2059302 RepID=A0A364Y3K4_9BACT|nr:IS21-like element helper ATPase IstB [Pseudochryseolinea flava]RAW01530.1 ATP-binding protein [Pseudochryseolinea flava]